MLESVFVCVYVCVCARACACPCMCPCVHVSDISIYFMHGNYIIRSLSASFYLTEPYCLCRWESYKVLGSMNILGDPIGWTLSVGGGICWDWP